MSGDDRILRLTENQRQQVRRLTGRDTHELELVLLDGPEALLLAWGFLRKPRGDAPQGEETVVRD